MYFSWLWFYFDTTQALGIDTEEDVHLLASYFMHVKGGKKQEEEEEEVTKFTIF